LIHKVNDHRQHNEQILIKEAIAMHFVLICIMCCISYRCFAFQIVEIHFRDKVHFFNSHRATTDSSALRSSNSRLSSRNRFGDAHQLVAVNGTPNLFTLRILTNISESMYEHERTLAEFVEVDKSGKNMFAAVFLSQQVRDRGNVGV
jgi:hypothetical protein